MFSSFAVFGNQLDKSCSSNKNNQTADDDCDENCDAFSFNNIEIKQHTDTGW